MVATFVPFLALLHAQQPGAETNLGCLLVARGTAAGDAAAGARLAGQKSRYTVWALQLMRGGTRSHGTAAKPDPLLADLSNAEIESLAAHLASLR